MHNSIEILFLKQRVPLKITINAFVYHKLWDQKNGHWSNYSEAAKVEDQFPEFFVSIFTKSSERSISKYDVEFCDSWW